jgi:hypothetical protein
MKDGGNYLALYLDYLLVRHLYFYSSMQEKGGHQLRQHQQ